ncbi:MAG TPA: glycosyltransferase family 39 protein [Candidatus Colwellbacteria bacterium]|nr:glycosyltransferase family 39 protein [Candidatus Colwellbacteria bacterium]
MIFNNGTLIFSAAAIFIVAFASLSSLIPDKLGKRIKIDSWWKKAGILLLIFVLLLVFSNILGQKTGFYPSDEEWEEAYFAKQLIDPSSEAIVGRMRHGFFFPAVFVFGNTVFGKINGPATINAFFLISAVILTGILAAKLSGKTWPGIVASLLLALNPAWLYGTAVFSGYPTLMSFCLSGFTLFAVLAVKEKKFIDYLGMITFAGMAFAAKIEYGVLFAVVGIAILMGFDRKEYKKSLLVAAIALIFILVLTTTIVNMREGDQFCGSEAQVGLVSQKIEKAVGSSIIRPFERIVKKIGGWRFSIAYTLDDIPRVIDYWTRKELLPISLIVILGIFFGIFKKDKGILIATVAFMATTLVYMTDCANYVQRFAIPNITIAAAIAATTIRNIPAEIMIKRKKKKRTKVNEFDLGSIAVIIVGIMLLFYIPRAINNLAYRRIERPTPEDMWRVLSHIPDTATIVMTSHHNEMMQLIFLENRNIKFVSLNDMFDRIDKSDGSNICSPEMNFCGENSYFIYTSSCDFFEHTKKICDTVSGFGEKIVSFDKIGVSIYRMVK